MVYDHYGRPAKEMYGSSPRSLSVANIYDDHTGRLTDTGIDKPDTSTPVEFSHYKYDPVGNLTAVSTSYGRDPARTDTQCVTLDPLRRITEAWTNTTSECATAPSASVVGGPDAYWTSYTYDALGNRRTETQHQTAGGPSTDTVRTYTAPAPGTHSLPKVTQTGSAPHDESFVYDQTGNTTERTIGTTKQNLIWDDEGRLQSLTQGTNSDSYRYDTEGQRFIRRDSTGTTLYLPGGNELHVDKVGLVAGSRYYSTGTKTIAVRNGAKLTFLFSDQHGTGTTQITTDAAQTVSQRKTTLFGAPRGTQAAGWTGDKGFVGGTKDADTGLTHLGAREYDPAIGRFISVDPLMDLGDPQQAHGYTYANNNPLTFTDPDGLKLFEGMDSGGIDSGGCGGCNTVAKSASVNAGYKSYYYAKEVSYITVGPTKIHFKSQSALDAAFKKVEKHQPGIFKKYNWVGDCVYNNGACSPTASPIPAYISHEMCNMEGISCDNPADTLEYYMGKGLFLEAEVGSELEKSVLKLIGVRKKPGAEEPASSSCKCFLAGTDVKMADGTTKDIDKIEIGDTVWATNPLTGESGPRDVTRVIVTEDDKHFNELTLTTPNGTEKLTATYEHPFWSPSENRWLKASELKPGKTLQTSDRSTATVKTNRAFTKHARTYNLTVDGLHTYYVLAGQTPVLVHNSNCPNGKLSDPLPRGMNNKIASAYDDVKAGRIPSHDTYGGREHPWWAGSKEYRVPGRPETDRILEKELPNGVKVYGWTSTHYTKIQRFSAPHFPDSGWN